MTSPFLIGIFGRCEQYTFDSMVFLIGYLVYRWCICLERRLPVTKLQPFDWWELRPFLISKLSFVKTFFLT